MDSARLIAAIYHDKPGVMYENPPPPSDYSEDDFESPFFIYPRPQSVKGVNFIKVDRKLFHKSLVNDGKGEEEASIETVREDENIEGKKEESRVGVLMNQINALELRIDESQAATSNYIEAPPGTISHLEQLIQERCSPNDFIVGLKFIRENQGENGDLYNCFLCGSVCPTIDIIDHLYLRKHKAKYLEKMLSDGHHNSINEINSLHIGESSRESLIDDECEKLMLEFGRGRPVICIAKKTF